MDYERAEVDVIMKKSVEEIKNNNCPLAFK